MGAFLLQWKSSKLVKQQDETEEHWLNQNSLAAFELVKWIYSQSNIRVLNRLDTILKLSGYKPAAELKLLASVIFMTKIWTVLEILGFISLKMFKLYLNIVEIDSLIQKYNNIAMF